MFGARVLTLALVAIASATGVLFGQARDFTPPSPETKLEETAGSRPSRNDGPYHPRRFFNPQQGAQQGDEEHPRDGRPRGRSPFVVTDSDGRRVTLDPPDGSPAYPLVLDLDQYTLDFEFETPRWISVVAPDGTPKVYWYMLFRVTNWETHPVYAHISFSIKTMSQDIFPDPQGLSDEEERELNERLYRQFVGDPREGGSLEGRLGFNPLEGQEHDPGTLDRIKQELLRGIKKSLALDYLSYPDRAILDAICNRERRWQEDAHGRLFNPLVPSHYFQWRARLMPEDNYTFPEIVIQDMRETTIGGAKLMRGDTFIVRPVFDAARNSGAQENRRTPAIRVTRVPFERGGTPEAAQDFDDFERFRESPLGRTSVNVLAESGYPGENFEAGQAEPRVALNTLTLWEAVWRYWPRYSKGSRVDAYGFVLRPGHPDYERGVLLNSDFTIRQFLHGAQYEQINPGDRREENPWAGMTVLDGTVTLPENPKQLPVCNGQRLISPHFDSFNNLVRTLNQLSEPLSRMNPRLAADIANDVTGLMGAHAARGRNDADVMRRYQSLISKLISEYENDAPMPYVVAYEIGEKIVRQSRLDFAEAHNQTAKIIGYAGNNALWNAQFHPAFCFVKHAAPRRYRANDKVLQNYRLPDQPAWTRPGDPNWGANLYRKIGDENPTDPRVFVNGLILDPYEHEDEVRRQPLPRSEINRFGASDRSGSYRGSTVDVSNQQPFFDRVWQRDGNDGRPVKRIDHQGRSLADGFRVYKPGDRVTPMEWRAYGSIVPINLLREYRRVGAYDDTRPFLRHGDLLVGQPRLILAEFRFDEEHFRSTTELRPFAKFAEGLMPRPTQVVVVAGDRDENKNGYWRHGFRCDAVGDYDAVVYEELPNVNKRDEFDSLVRNTDILENALRGRSRVNVEELARLRYLRVVPMLDDHGVALDYVHPLTNEKIPQRVPVLPDNPDEQPRIQRDEGGNPVWAKAYAKLPRYVYEYDYLKITRDQAQVNRTHQFNSNFDMNRLEEDARRGQRPSGDAYWGNSSENASSAIVQGMTGLFRTDDRPTLAAARFNVHFRQGDHIVIDKRHIVRTIPRDGDDRDRNDPNFNPYDRVVVRDLGGVAKVLNPDEGGRLETFRDPSWRAQGVTFFGRIVDAKSDTEKTYFEITREIGEIVPAIAEGVAIFGELDRQWDFMNVYISGIKGPIRRDGLNEVEYSTMPNQVGGNNVQRYEYSPRFVRENWVLMLRFNRPGDEFSVHQDKVTFGRRYWFLDGTPQELTIRGGR